MNEQFDGMQAGLVAVEHDQLPRIELMQLATQFRTDRATGAGDEHPPVGDVGRHRSQVGLHGPATDDVFDIDVAQRRELQRRAPQLFGERWQLQAAQLGRGARGEDGPDLFRAHPVDRDDDPGRARAFGHRGQISQRAEHRNAVDVQLALGPVVIEKADRPVERVMVAHHPQGQGRADLPGADDEDRLGRIGR